MRTSTLNQMQRLHEQHAWAFRGYGRDTRDLVAMAELFDDRTRRMYELAERPSRMMRSSVVDTASASLHSRRRVLDRALTPATARQLFAAQAALEPTRRVEEMLRQAVDIAAGQALYERRMRPWSAAGLDPALAESESAAAEELASEVSGAESEVSARTDSELSVGAPDSVGRLADFHARVERLSPSERRSLELNLVGIALAIAPVVLLWGKAGGIPAALAAGHLMKSILDLVNSIRALYEDGSADSE